MRLTFCITYFCAVIILASCDSLHTTKVLKVGHGLSENHPVHQALLFMNDDLKKRSNNTLSLKIYPAAQLGGEREALELAQLGGLDIVKVSAATMENFVPEFRVFNLPYLFEDKEHRLKVFENEVGEELMNQTEKYRLKSLCFYEAGSRSFYTVDKPILSPNDLKGLKIRVMRSRTAVEMMDALGGSATPISFGELYSALQQRVVDGAENNLASFYTNRHYELCKHFTFDEHSCIPDIVVISTETWNKLNNQQQQWIEEAAKNSAKYEQKLWDDFEVAAMQDAKAKGVNFYQTDRKEFMRLTSSLYSDENLGDLVQWVRKIKAVKDEKKD